MKLFHSFNLEMLYTYTPKSALTAPLTFSLSVNIMIYAFGLKVDSR